MRKLIISLIIALGATSCGTTSLYYWGYQTQGTSAYEHLSYKRSDKESPKTICKVVEMYEHLLANPGGLRQVPPPGICAECVYASAARNCGYILQERNKQPVAVVQR